jgi:hypothetical protein
MCSELRHHSGFRGRAASPPCLADLPAPCASYPRSCERLLTPPFLWPAFWVIAGLPIILELMPTAALNVAGVGSGHAALMSFQSVLAALHVL